MRMDDVTRELPGLPLPPRPPRPRGRPSTGRAKTDAERSKEKRLRLQAQGKQQVSITLSIEVIEAMKKHIEFKDLTLGDAAEKALRDRFLRKR